MPQLATGRVKTNAVLWNPSTLGGKVGILTLTVERIYGYVQMKELRMTAGVSKLKIVA